MALLRACSAWREVVGLNRSALISQSSTTLHAYSWRPYTSEAIEEGSETLPERISKFPDLSVEKFLEAAGGSKFATMKKKESNFKVVDDVLVAESGTLKRFGMGVKERKMLRNKAEQFKQGLWSP